MSQYFAETIDAPFERVLLMVRDELSSEGFEMVTHLETQNSIKSKLGDQFRRYIVFAGEASSGPAGAADATTGSNVIVQETSEGEVQISAFDPFLANPASTGQGTAHLKRVRRIIARLTAALDAIIRESRLGGS